MENKLESIIKNHLDKIVEKISKKFGIDQELVYLCINEDEKLDDIKTKISVTSIESIPKYCNHIITRGIRSGNFCGRKVAAGIDKCHAHKLKVVNKTISQNNIDIVLRYDPNIKRKIHSDTNIVFVEQDKNCKLNKQVDGVLENGVIRKLTEKDRELCDKYGFIYDKTISELL